MVDASHQVTYKGFIYVKHKEGERFSLSQVRECSTLLDKPKKAQNIHPLFARGFQTKLTLRIRDEALRVYVDDPTASPLVVMDHPVHKIVFVVAVDKDVFIVVKHDLRGKGTMFKCHGFKLEKKDQARKLSNDTARVCQDVLNKLRATRKFVRNNSSKVVQSKPRRRPSGTSVNGVRFRPTRRGQSDSDTVLLKRYIAQARQTIMMGSADAPDITEEDEKQVEQTIAGKDEALDDKQLASMRAELRVAVDAVSPLDAESSADGDDDEEQTINFEWDDTFDDDFARMTMFVHNSGKQPEVPRYADVTLDSAMFDCTDV
eukprot:TRINITY_DN2928_c0_g1_i1.p1 TRINITY_DN2928_c0_g1~~TRINITY_DN2928_c0_g1_i1.p1  ORF type:complete len:317 (+),score=77.22 TRINITY_DN2928_c0_g1_i1:283-1233(+)